MEVPVFIGTYYGKQETTCHKATIQEEMENLSEEILELRREGEVVLCMDANAKVGLLGEEMSRNGRLINNVFQECEMKIINGTEKCKGSITRQNRKRPEENSAIDFIVSSYQASQWITEVKIDEAGDFRMRGINESDHNTILIDVNITKLQKQKHDKRTIWNLKAPPEKFADFRLKLDALTTRANTMMSSKQKSMTERYSSWEKLVYKSAMSTIGKTTVAIGRPPRISEAMKVLRKERKQKKKEFEEEKCPIKKKEKLHEYITKQHEVNEEAVNEESERIKIRLKE